MKRKSLLLTLLAVSSGLSYALPVPAVQESVKPLPQPFRITLSPAANPFTTSPRRINTADLSAYRLTGPSSIGVNREVYTGVPSSDRKAAKIVTKTPYEGTLPDFHGAVCFSNEWINEAQWGINTISSEATTPVYVDGTFVTSYGQVYAGDKYMVTKPMVYGTFVYDMDYVIYDTNTWTSTTIPGDYRFKARAMTMDPLSHRVYALTENEDDKTYQFSIFDMDNYTWKVIKDYQVTDDWAALMASPKGDIYAISRPGMLYKIDRSTGDYSEIGSTGLASTKMTAGTIDPATGKCYYVWYTGDDSEMYEINLETAEATFLFALPGKAEVLSLYIPESPVSEDAPAGVSGLSATFDNGSKVGTITFTAPSATVGGAALEGSLNYTASVNGEQIATGTVSPSEEVTVEVSVEASGDYTFTVTVSNSAGSGETAILSTWIGNDIPAAVKSVKLAAVDGILNLTWDAVTTGLQGEYFNPDNVTYTVISYPDGNIAASGLTETSYITSIPESEELQILSYGVIAVNDDVKSAESLSNSYISGYLTAPFSEDFENAACMSFFTVYDANNDGKTWTHQIFGGEGRVYFDYSYNTPVDDWLVLHPIRLDAGAMYTIGCDAKATGYYAEKFEIKVSSSSDLESLRNAPNVLDIVSLTAETYETFSGTFIPEESGIYYIAIHGCSDKYMNKLYVDNLFVSEGVNVKAPGAVTAAEVIADASGALKAKVKFNAPSTDMSGKSLDTIDYITVSRDGNEIGRVDNPSTGAEVSVVDNSPVNGINEYTITAVNVYGTGLTAKVNGYVGLVAPIAPETVAVSYGANTGEAVITWDSSEFDEYGHTLTEDNVSYNILRSIDNGSAKVVASGVKGNSYIDQAVDPTDAQKFVYYIVQAETAGGSSTYAFSNIYPLGEPYATPAHEAFDLNRMNYIWITEVPDGSFTSWDLFEPSELPFESLDGNAIAMAYAQYDSGFNTSYFFSGLFDLSGLSKPVLSFYLFDVVCNNKLNIRINDGEKWSVLSNISLGEKNMEWRKVSIDLSAYAGKAVCFELEANCTDINLIAIDDFRVTDDFNNNLSAISITAPDKVNANEKFTVEVRYENSAKNAVEDYSVALYADDEFFTEISGETIAANEFKTAVFEIELPVVSPESIEFKGVINYNADEYETDNVTYTTNVKVNIPVLPAPRDLTATQSNNSVELSWNEPDLSVTLANPRLDDIESYVPFSSGLPGSEVANDNIGDWNMYDVDGLDTYSIGGGMLGEFSNDTNPKAFIVYDSHQVEDNVFACHSGHQMFMSLCSKGGANDDWLVSPRLAGCAQTISFYEKSITSYGPDTFEVLYSTTGKEIDDFILIERTEGSEDWRCRYYDLPEGAVYFAIRCVSDDKYAFLIDDITMITEKDVLSALTIAGYNLYCDGKRVNDEPLSEMSYTHSGLKDGIHTYHVACIYDIYGESAPSEPVQIDCKGMSGIDSVANESNGITVITRKGEIVVKGAEGVMLTVSDAAGRQIYSAVPNAEAVIPAASGIYIVATPSSVVKVIVK